jgi:hypothetical protein
MTLEKKKLILAVSALASIVVPRILRAEETRAPQANILKGNWESGGSASLRSGFPDEPASYGFGVSAPFRYFVGRGA